MKTFILLATLMTSTAFAQESVDLTNKAIVCSIEVKADFQGVRPSRTEVLNVAAKFIDSDAGSTKFIAGDTFKLNLYGDAPGGVGLRAANPAFNSATNRYEENRIKISLAHAGKYSMNSKESRACQRDPGCLEMGPSLNDYIGTIGADGKSIKLSNDVEGSIDLPNFKLLSCKLTKTPFSLIFSKGKVLSSAFID